MYSCSICSYNSKHKANLVRHLDCTERRKNKHNQEILRDINKQLHELYPHKYEETVTNNSEIQNQIVQNDDEMKQILIRLVNKIEELTEKPTINKNIQNNNTINYTDLKLNIGLFFGQTNCDYIQTQEYLLQILEEAPDSCIKMFKDLFYDQNHLENCIIHIPDEMLLVSDDNSERVVKCLTHHGWENKTDEAIISRFLVTFFVDFTHHLLDEIYENKQITKEDYDIWNERIDTVHGDNNRPLPEIIDQCRKIMEENNYVSKILYEATKHLTPEEMVRKSKLSSNQLRWIMGRQHQDFLGTISRPKKKPKKVTIKSSKKCRTN